MLKPLEKIEARLDETLERVFSSPAFLRGVSGILNFNSYRKILVNRGLTATWKLLQLPNKRDQERTLHLLSDLHLRVCELEDSLAEPHPRAAAAQSPGIRPSRAPRKQARVDAESVAIQ